MKYSFILEIDDISKNDINELISVLSDNKIKFHVLKSDKELKENQKYKEVFNKIKARQEKFRDYLKNTLISVNEELINKTYGEDYIEWLLHRRTLFDDVLKKYDLIMKGVKWRDK